MICLSEFYSLFVRMKIIRRSCIESCSKCADLVEWLCCLCSATRITFCSNLLIYDSIVHCECGLGLLFFAIKCPVFLFFMMVEFSLSCVLKFRAPKWRTDVTYRFQANLLRNKGNCCGLQCLCFQVTVVNSNS